MCIYIYLSIYIYWGREKKGVYFRDYSLVRGKIIGEEYPDGSVITKHACRDESIDSLFFPIHIALYFYVPSTVLRKNRHTSDIHMYIYIYIFFSFRRVTIDALLCKIQNLQIASLPIKIQVLAIHVFRYCARYNCISLKKIFI